MAVVKILEWPFGRRTAIERRRDMARRRPCRVVSSRSLAGAVTYVVVCGRIHTAITSELTAQRRATWPLKTSL